MKKKLYLLLVFVFLLCVTTGCGNKNADKKQGNTKKANPEDCILMATTSDSTTAFWGDRGK